MPVLQAFIDDSGKEKDSHSMVLAGYLASTDRWRAFSASWKEILSRYRLASFHMIDAWRMSREYRQIGPIGRNQLLFELTNCIQKHAEHAFVLSIDTESFRHWFDRDEFPDIHATRPYLMSFAGMLTMISDHVYNYRDDHDLAVIFDEQGGESAARVLTSVDDLRNAAIPHGRAAMRIPIPQFASDATVPPLQAADLLAWLCRRENHNYRSGRNWRDTAERQLLDRALAVPNTVKLLGDRELEAMSSHAAWNLEKAAADRRRN